MGRSVLQSPIVTTSHSFYEFSAFPFGFWFIMQMSRSSCGFRRPRPHGTFFMNFFFVGTDAPGLTRKVNCVVLSDNFRYVVVSCPPGTNT